MNINSQLIAYSEDLHAGDMRQLIAYSEDLPGIWNS